MGRTTSSMYTALVNKTSNCGGKVYIKPGDVANSYVIHKIEGASNICGSQMPLGGSFSASNLAKLKAWICNGAKNN